MHEFDELIRSINPEIHARLKTAVETGRWADGTRLRREQVEQCLQAIIAWEQRNLAPEEQTGYMPDACASRKQPGAAETPVQNLQLRAPATRKPAH